MASSFSGIFRKIGDRDQFDDDRRTSCDTILSNKFILVTFGLNNFRPRSFFVIHSLQDTVLVLAGGLLTRQFCAFYAIQSLQFFKFNPFFAWYTGGRTDKQFRESPPKQIRIWQDHHENKTISRKLEILKPKLNAKSYFGYCSIGCFCHSIRKSDESCSSSVVVCWWYYSPKPDNNCYTLVLATAKNPIYQKEEQPCFIKSEALTFLKLYCWIEGVDLSRSVCGLISRAGEKRLLIYRLTPKCAAELSQIICWNRFSLSFFLITDDVSSADRLYSVLCVSWGMIRLSMLEFC